MELPLRVSDDGLGVAAAWCGALAGRLASNGVPTGVGSTWLSSHAAVSAANARVAAAGPRCAARVAATATNLAVAANGYADNEARSAAQLRAVHSARTC